MRWVLGLLAAGGLASGCASIPAGRQAIDRVDIEGTDEVDEADVRDRLATVKSSKFLGLFQGVVFDYEVYNPGTLERDLARVKRYYEARGFYDVKVRGGRVVRTDDNHVRVEIEVEEGEPIRVESVEVDGEQGLDEATVKRLAEAKRGLKAGERFDEDTYGATQKALRKALTDRGYAHARVRRQAQVDLVTRTARVRYRLRPGPVAHYGEVTVEGLRGLPEAPVRAALGIKPGQRYSTADLEAGRVAVLDLGAFAAVDLAPGLAGPDEAPKEEVPIRVQVEPTSLHGVRLGGGVEVDVLKSDVHALLGWEHRNFLGGLRHLTVTARPGLVFYPTRFPSFQAPTAYLPELRLQAELVQPGFLEPRTRGSVRAQYEVSPVLLSTVYDPTASVVGYREARGAVGLDRSFGRHVYGSVSLNGQRNVPFTYVGPQDPALQPVQILYVELLTQFDHRNDKIHPHQGFLLSNDLQVAPGLFDAQDIRVQPEARGYVPLGRKVTVAVRGSVGFLFPFSYGGTLKSNTQSGKPPPGVDRAAWVRDVQLTYLRAFFSGGPTSNRGYALRGVGPHGVVPFFQPQLAAQALQQGCDADVTNDPRCEQPLGGLSLWESSVELRFPLLNALTGATFCDASDVAPGQVQLRFTYLHLSCGLGLRYDTPVGPIRADVGYRIPGLQILGHPDEDVEGIPPTLFGVPLAVSLGIGETF